VTEQIVELIQKQPLLARFLIHLRQRKAVKELTVVVGAGATWDAGAPLWDELLNRIRAALRPRGPKLKKYRNLGVHPAVLGTILQNRYSGKDWSNASQLKIDNDWFKIIQGAIYRNVPESRPELFQKHPYLWELARLCYSARLVINFNFDDILSEAMKGFAQENQVYKLSIPSVIWKPALLERRDSALIYHINGVITRGEGKKRSENLVLTEDAFYDAELRSPKVRIDHVLAKFVSTTMFIIGHSLSDNSLKGYLRQSKMINPANHHYHVHWLMSQDSLTEEERKEIFDANLELYNLITLFMTTDEIRSFLFAMNATDAEFDEALRSSGQNVSQVFYIVGPVAAGKTSVLEYLRCFATQEEWLGENPREMYIASDRVGHEKITMIDNWVYDQVRLKNEQLVGASKGFIFVDRGPLDLFAFSESDGQWPDKAKQVRGKLRGQKLASGPVVFLHADGQTLVDRNWKRGRTPDVSGSAEYLVRQGSTLAEIYRTRTVFETDQVSPDLIAMKVARTALLGEHHVIDVHAKLELVARGGRAALSS
jgi:predicted ATPase